MFNYSSSPDLLESAAGSHKLFTKAFQSAATLRRVVFVLTASLIAGMLFGSALAFARTQAGENVQISGFAFSPAVITVTVGSVVTWTNQDSSAHTVKEAGGAFESPGLGKNGVYTRTFTTTGEMDYVCGIHPFMQGKLQIVPDAVIPKKLVYIPVVVR